MIDRFWNKFNIITKDHFYHSGGKIENRQSVVEALVCNFNIDEFNGEETIIESNEQLELF